MISILTLVDTALIAVLLLIIVFSGYENFVSKLSIGDHEDRPAWMGNISFSDLKMKLIGAIVAISAVELLQAFPISTQLTGEQIGWKFAIHLSFMVSGLLFAASDWISDGRKSLWRTDRQCRRCAWVGSVLQAATIFFQGTAGRRVR